MTRIPACAAVVALLPALASAQEAPRSTFVAAPLPGASSDSLGRALLEDKSSYSLYGFLRLDMMYDDSRMNDPLIPYLVRSEDPSPPGGAPADAVAMPDDDEFALSPRLTRVGGKFTSEDAVAGWGDADLSGQVEVDFYNIGLGDSDSRSALRMRLAFLKLDWGSWSLLAGQDWDVISPLYPAVNADLVMWGAGNTGDRRPQLTAQHKWETGNGYLSTEFGIALTGAVGGTTVAGGLRSGENSGRPMVNARVGYHGELARGGKYQLGLWAHDSEESFDATGAGSDQDYSSNSFGIDVVVPIWRDKVWVKGEYFTGENLRDVRGGILQGVNGTTGDEIEARGGWIELGWQAWEKTSFHFGYSFDDPEDADLSNFMASRNTVPYVATRYRDGDFAAGLELLFWETEYVGLESGDALRLVGFMAYDF